MRRFRFRVGVRSSGPIGLAFLALGPLGQDKLGLLRVFGDDPILFGGGRAADGAVKGVVVEAKGATHVVGKELFNVSSEDAFWGWIDERLSVGGGGRRRTIGVGATATSTTATMATAAAITTATTATSMLLSTAGGWVGIFGDLVVAIFILKKMFKLGDGGIDNRRFTPLEAREHVRVALLVPWLERRRAGAGRLW